jgi:hypothetical protein
VFARIAEFPLESGMGAWGVYIALRLASGQPSSNAIASLPDWATVLWGCLMIVGSISMFAGVYVKPPSTRIIGQGMYLFAGALISYSAAVVGASGWRRGGAIASFLLILGLVCCIRAWWLREQEIAFLKELASPTERKDV